MTSTPSVVRLAKPEDSTALFDFFVFAHIDNGFLPLSAAKVAERIILATNNQGGGIIGIIEGKNGIEATTGLMLNTVWYSDKYYLSDMLTFVHPDCRRSKHAQALIKFQKKCADNMGVQLGYKVPLVVGITTRKSLEAKMRLFQREFTQIGGWFVYGDNSIIPEDNIQQRHINFYKAPKLVKV